MATHTIMLPDRRYGRAMRTILWDDEAGTFSGDHSDVPCLNKRVAGYEPEWLVSDEFRVWIEGPASTRRGSPTKGALPSPCRRSSTAARRSPSSAALWSLSPAVARRDALYDWSTRTVR